MNDVKYIDDLVCPIGKYPLKVTGDMLECTNCGVKFPVKEGIPLLLIDDAVLPVGIKNYTELMCSPKNTELK